MKKVLKRTIIRLYSQGWISGITVAKLFKHFDLRGH